MQRGFQTVQIGLERAELPVDVVSLLGQRIEPLLHLQRPAQGCTRSVVVRVRNRALCLTVAGVEVCGRLPGQGLHPVPDGGEVRYAATCPVEVFLLLPLRLPERGDWVDGFLRITA